MFDDNAIYECYLKIIKKFYFIHSNKRNEYESHMYRRWYNIYKNCIHITYKKLTDNIKG